MDRKDVSQTFARGLGVIAAFGSDGPELTIPQIARRTGLNRTVVRRLVFTLVDLGYMSERDRAYALTPRILTLGHGFLQSRRVGAAIQPILVEATRGTGLPVSLAMRDDLQAVYVAHAPADAELITEGFTIGTSMPLLTTGIGRAIAAFCAEPERGRILADAPLKPHTAKTVVDRGRIAGILDAAHERGFAHVVSEFESGVASVAVPVVRMSGELIGAIGVAAPVRRIAGAARAEMLADDLKTRASQLAAIL